MKIDDVKDIKEGMAANLFGRGAAAGINSKIGKQKGQTQEHILAQDIMAKFKTTSQIGQVDRAVQEQLEPSTKAVKGVGMNAKLRQMVNDLHLNNKD